nr:PqqD family peptide modification chaperone [Elioraea sp.]
MGTCLAYDPDRARLHTLNPTAWLILSLCDGRPRAAIAAEFATTLRGLAGPAPEQGAFSRGLARLMSLGLVITGSPQTRSSSPQKETAP